MTGFLSLGRHWQYFKYVLIHKAFVARAGWRCADTWWEFWLCLLHDNSKFLPDEWNPYATHFYAPDGSKRTKQGKDGFYDDEPDDTKFDRAWLKHIRRNRHHPQHWALIYHAACQCMDSRESFWAREDVLLHDDGGATCMTCLTDVDRSAMQVIMNEMPREYITEMLCDWYGAGMAQGTPDTLAWYTARGHKHPMGPVTRALVEQRLGYVRETE